MKSDSRKDPIHHTRKIGAKMRLLIAHLRQDVAKVAEPKAQALFETSAEVLTGLAKAFVDYEKKTERAWQPKRPARRPKRGTVHASRR